MCFDPAIYEKLDHDILSQNIAFVKCDAFNSSSEELSLNALELINALKFDKLLIHHHQQSRVNGLMHSLNLHLGSKF